MKIPQYVLKPVEEIARAVIVAVGAYLVMSIQAGTVQPTRTSIIALLAGAVPIAWAAARAALNATPLTPTPPPKLTSKP